MTAVAPVPGQRPRRPRWRRVLGSLLSIALVVAVFAWFLPQFTSLSAVWESVQAMTGWQIAVLAVATLWNLATYQFVMVTTTPGNDALLEEIAAQPGTRVTRGKTADNLDLPEGWRVRMEALYGGGASESAVRSRWSKALNTAGVT